MLLSNGLHHSENLPVKFGFSPKIVPANIVQKLPSQRCSKPLFIPIFNFSHKRPTFAFTGESGYTLGFANRIAHKGTHGETRGDSGGGGITTLGPFRTFRKPCVARCQNGKLCRFLRSGGRSSPHDSYFLANTQNFLLAVPVANAFALWYDKFSKLNLSSCSILIKILF